MASSSNKTSSYVADAATCYCAIVLAALILLSSVSSLEFDNSLSRTMNRPCEEIYVVGEGETLNTISEKCGDPFIVEQNPHIHDPDDVFPGLVIKITNSNSRRW